MSWHLPIYEAIVQAAVAGLLVLAIASLALVFIRQPARRIRVIEMALVGLILVPLAALAPGYPRFAILPARSPAEPQAPAGPSEATPPETPSSEALAKARHVEPPAVLLPVEPVPPENWTPESPPAENRLAADPPARAAAEPAPETHKPETKRPAEAPVVAAPLWGPQDARLWIVVGYLVGAVGMFAWSLLGLAAAWRLMRASHAANQVCRAVFDEVAGPAGRRVALRVSPLAGQPCTFWWRRPTIVLPERLARANAEGPLRFALAHEWSHVARGDVRTWWLAGVARWFYFYQPLVWYLRGELRLCQDYLADAAGAGESAEDYAEFLTSYSTGRRGGLAAGLGIAGRPSELHRRIVMLVERPLPLEHAAPRRWNRIVVALAVLVVAAVACVRAEPQPPAEAQANPPDAPDADTPPPAEPAAGQGGTRDTAAEAKQLNDQLLERLKQTLWELDDLIFTVRGKVDNPAESPQLKELLRERQAVATALERYMAEARRQAKAEEAYRAQSRDLGTKATRPAPPATTLTPAGPLVSPYLQRLQTQNAEPFRGRIRPGDILAIDLRGGLPEGGLKQATVEPDGNLPLGAQYGRVHVAGKTLLEAQDAVQNQLKEILIDPSVQLTYAGHDSGVVAADDADRSAPKREAALPPLPPIPPADLLSEAPAARKLEPLDTVEVLIPLKPQIYRQIVDGKLVELSGPMPKFSGTYVVEPSGELALPYGYGRVPVAGLDPRQAGQAIRDRLSEKMLTRTALPSVHVVPRGRAVFPEGKTPPADYRVRVGDTLLTGVAVTGSDAEIELWSAQVDEAGNIHGNPSIHVEGLTLAEVEATMRKEAKYKLPAGFGGEGKISEPQEIERPWYVTIGGWREEADAEVIDRIEGSLAPRLEELKTMVRQLQSKP